MTYLDKYKEEHPDWTIESIEDLIDNDCPNEHGMRNPIHCFDRCRYCWNSEIPETEEKENTKMEEKKDVKELMNNIEELKKQVAKLEKYKKYDKAAEELKVMYDALINNGFPEPMAFQIFMEILRVGIN